MLGLYFIILLFTEHTPKPIPVKNKCQQNVSQSRFAYKIKLRAVKGKILFKVSFTYREGSKEYFSNMKLLTSKLELFFSFTDCSYMDTLSFE